MFRDGGYSSSLQNDGYSSSAQNGGYSSSVQEGGYSSSAYAAQPTYIAHSPPVQVTQTPYGFYSSTQPVRRYHSHIDDNAPCCSIL